MTLTARDFRAIAAVIAGSGTVIEVTLGLADYFASVNPRFDRERFLAACNISG